MVKAVVLGLAIIVPVLPLTVWAQHAIEGFIEAGDRVAVFFYFPARLCALVGFVLMFYQFVLSARMSFLEHVFSRPKLVGTHRSMGKVGFLLILAHGLLMIVVDYLDFGALIFTWQKLIGMVALFLLTIGVIAAWHFRLLEFSAKTWKKIHLLGYVAFPLAFLHAISIGLTLRQSRPITVLFTMLFAWYVAMVATRLFGAARGVLHPAPAAGQKPATSQTPGVGQKPAAGQTPGAGQRPATSQTPGAGQRPATGQTPGVGQKSSAGRTPTNGG